jgi:hypothetical protein
LGGKLAARVAEQGLDFGKTLRHQQIAGGDKCPLKGAFRSLRTDFELPGRGGLGAGGLVSAACCVAPADDAGNVFGPLVWALALPAPG